MHKVMAVITAYNREDFVAKCIESLVQARSDTLEVEILIMDNGSVDNTAAVARNAASGVRVESTPDNRPIADAINRGLSIAYHDPATTHILLMNEDTQFTPGSVERLVAASEGHPWSFITPLQRNYRAPERLDDNALKDVLTVRELVEDAVLQRPLKEVYPVRTIIAAAMFGKTEAWQHVGLFDGTFWFYGVDDDFCNRALYMGYEILIAPASHLYHAHGKLDVAPQPDRFRVPQRWRSETQARYLFRLKNVQYPLYYNYLTTLWYACETSLGCAVKFWPYGVVHALLLYWHCLVRCPKLHRLRKEHFNPERRVR